ncbi:MAG: DUF4139 domain-containing protein [Fimbriimonadaceae bacterium]
MRRVFTYSALCLAIIAVAAVGCLKASAKEGLQSDEGREIELVVYSQDFAQVNEVRTVGLLDGTARVGLTQVSQQLDQSSLIYDWPDTSSAQVTSTTYDLGSLSGQSLLSQLVGREVSLVYRGDNGREGARQTGILEVAAPGNIVVRVGDTLVVNPNATIETAAGEVATMPRLTAFVQNGKREDVPLTVSYMTRGLSWGADYVLTLDPGTDPADLECWATVTNNTGIDFPAAKIKFVAGAPNRNVVATNAPREYAFDQKERAERFQGGGFRMDAEIDIDAEVLGELIAYPYESKATLRNNQTNRVLMMDAPKVTVARDYAIRLPYYGTTDPQQRLKATLSLAFKNTEDAGLGKPLPAGSVRVYEPVKGGAPNYIGAAAIGNTPKDDRIDLTLSEVFNVYARAKTTETKKLDKKRTQFTYEVTVTNEKDKPLDVRVVRDFYGAWTITNESLKSTRPSAASAQWVLTVPAGGSTVLTYTVVVG